MGVAGGKGAASPHGGTDDAFATARALLEQAETDADRARAAADRYVRQREQEAALLVAKARRVLQAAEERAAVIVAAAQAGAVAPPDRVGAIDLRDDPATGADEIGRVIAPGATRLTRGGHPSRLDTLLASAIESAVDDTFTGRASA